MKCIKTGFYAAMPRDMFLYGDAFASGHPCYSEAAVMQPQHDLILRVTSMSDEVPPVIHIRLDTWEVWFDELRSQKVDTRALIWQPCSTLVASADQWQWLGYHGEPI